MYQKEAQDFSSLKTKYKLRVAPYKDMDANFFKVCRSIFILKDSKAIHLYLYLCNCYNYKTEKVFPSYDNISKSTGLTRNTISEKLKILQQLRLIKIKKRKVGTYFNNIYTINYITEIVEKNIVNDSLEIEEVVDIEDNFENTLEDVNINIKSEYEK